MSLNLHNVLYTNPIQGTIRGMELKINMLQYWFFIHFIHSDCACRTRLASVSLPLKGWGDAFVEI